jgi:hypothetical protein
VEVPYRGDVNATMLDVLGGLRSACTYVGAGKLKVCFALSHACYRYQIVNPCRLYVLGKCPHFPKMDLHERVNEKRGGGART